MNEERETPLRGLLLGGPRHGAVTWGGAANGRARRALSCSCSSSGSSCRSSSCPRSSCSRSSCSFPSFPPASAGGRAGAAAWIAASIAALAMGRGRSPRPPCSLALRWLLMTTLASAVSSSWIPQSRPIPSEADFCGMREYFANDHCCLLCPAGTHVADFCQLPRTLGRCEPCRPGEFTAHPNGLYACRPCKQCHPEDKVTVAPCTRFSDTRCQCKPNHYCELPACEVCLPCRRSCPPGEVVLHKCSQTADTECGPPRAAGHTTYSIWSVLGVVAIVVVVVLLIGTVAFFLTSRCRSQLGRGNADQKEPMIPNAKMSLLSKIKEVGLEEFFQSSLSETE
uniref:TNFR-Cys domain-containing protein n=1 Tax=Ornithorhynchus anatinus TaxID=9258 RepID=A0A6I8NFX5_ORNAN